MSGIAKGYRDPLSCPHLSGRQSAAGKQLERRHRAGIQGASLSLLPIQSILAQSDKSRRPGGRASSSNNVSFLICLTRQSCPWEVAVFPVAVEIGRAHV